MTIRTPRRPTHSISRIPRVLLVIALFALLGAGCSSDTDGEQPGLAEQTEVEASLPDAGGAQPGVGGEPVDAAFADIPLPSGAQPFAPATVEDGVTVQTFEVTAMSAQQVAEHFRDALPDRGWDEGVDDSEGVAGESVEQVQTTWTQDGQTLLVTAADLDGQDSQVSLQVSG